MNLKWMAGRLLMGTWTHVADRLGQKRREEKSVNSLDRPLCRFGYSGGNWSTHSVYFADGNGNITYMLNSSQAMVASYRYDPFGNTVSKTGSLSDANLYRFSSKEIHLNSGMYYYGYRFYDPSLQRWINRDPLSDAGFNTISSQPAFRTQRDANLYTFVLNEPTDDYDAFGLSPGGPYHPPDGVSLSCDPSDGCGRLSAKMNLLRKTIASHTGWDRKMPPPRGGGRHADEIADFWRAYAKCQALHAARGCEDPKPPGCWERMLMRVPGSDQAWINAANLSEIVAVTALTGAVMISSGGAAAPALTPALIRVGVR